MGEDNRCPNDTRFNNKWTIETHGGRKQGASVGDKNSILESYVFSFLGVPSHSFFLAVVCNASVGYDDDSREEVAPLSAVANARAVRLRHKPRS